MPDLAGPVIAVGGLGADSHSVGLFILRHGLEAADFHIINLGIQNEFDRFADVSKNCDAVLVSNMDGHCRHYLYGLTSLPGSCLWYLGGHPTMSSHADDLRRLGFKRVYTEFVSIDKVVAALRSDLADVVSRPRVEDQRRLFEALREAGADVLSFQVDSLTRDGRYADVERVLAENGDLNGFPVVNHGVETPRELTGECGVPVQTRHSGFVPDELEEQRLEATVRALLDAIRALRPGDTAGCVQEAFRRGYLDVPFSPSKFNAGRMLTCRDQSGAVRIVHSGGLPLPADIAAFEAVRAGERLAATGIARDQAWRAVTEDVLRTAAHGLTWPLDAAAPPASFRSPQEVGVAVLAHVREGLVEGNFLNAYSSVGIAGDMAAGLNEVGR